jgi:HSP20 family protein
MVDRGRLRYSVIEDVARRGKEGRTMAIMRRDPFEGLREMRRGVDRLFDEVITRRPPLELRRVAEWEPAVEMYETESEVIAKAALPNIDPKQVEIVVTNDAITLKGETKHEEEHKGRNYYHREFEFGIFQRTLPLLTEVKGAEAKATYKDGVLEIKVPKSERAKATAVKVKVDSQ